MRYQPPDWFIKFYAAHYPALTISANGDVIRLADEESTTIYTAPAPGRWKERFLNRK